MEIFRLKRQERTRVISSSHHHQPLSHLKLRIRRRDKAQKLAYRLERRGRMSYILCQNIHLISNSNKARHHIILIEVRNNSHRKYIFVLIILHHVSWWLLDWILNMHLYSLRNRSWFCCFLITQTGKNFPYKNREKFP